MGFQCAAGFNVTLGECLLDSALDRILEQNLKAFEGEKFFIFECLRDIRSDFFTSRCLSTATYVDVESQNWEFLRVACHACGKIVTIDCKGNRSVF